MDCNYFLLSLNQLCWSVLTSTIEILRHFAHVQRFRISENSFDSELRYFASINCFLQHMAVINTHVSMQPAELFRVQLDTAPILVGLPRLASVIWYFSSSKQHIYSLSGLEWILRWTRYHQHDYLQTTCTSGHDFTNMTPTLKVTCSHI